MQTESIKRPRGRPSLPDEQKKRALTIMLDPEQHALIREHAEAEGVGQGAVVRGLLEKGIKSLRRQEKVGSKK